MRDEKEQNENTLAFPRNRGLAKRSAKLIQRGLNSLREETVLSAASNFDEDKYKQFKPLFIAGLQHIVGDVSNVRAVIHSLLKTLNEEYGFKPEVIKQMKPYIVRFVEDAGNIAKKGEILQNIWNDIGECTRCGLCQNRSNIVHSEGNPQARLIFIGEAPGQTEDTQGRPFVGPAGQLLNNIIKAMGFKREEVFVGNLVRCRPLQNRAPLPDEVAMCKRFLLSELAIIQPEVIITLGNNATKGLLNTQENIVKLRGSFQDFHNIKVMPTFHPAYLLRDPSKKVDVWKDVKMVRDYLRQTT